METKGRDASDPESYIVGLGGADEDGSWYLDVRNLSRSQLQFLFSRLRARPLTAFNVVFDWAFLWAKWGLSDLQWECCTYGLFRQLATEGFEQQRWGLGTLETDVLGWEHSNKELLDELLRKHSLKKGDMWKLADLEPVPFGRYCAEDADAHWQAYEELTKTVENLGEEGRYLAEFHKGPWMTSAVRLNIEQQLRGIKINVPKLQTYRDRLVREIEELKEEFFSVPEVVGPVQEYNQRFVEAHLEKEEGKIKKDGSKGKAWENWNQKLEEIKATNYFKLNSPQQVGWLFFEKLGYPIKEYTKGGEGSTKQDFLIFYGAPGKALLKVKKKMKLLGSFVDACLGLQRDGVLHPMTKSAGTITGRASGGELGE